MAVTVVVLGRLADLAGVGELEMAGPVDWAALLERLHGAMGEAASGERVKLALNGAVLADKTALLARDGDEIALLPPVSGG